jgi:hypothetical protein
MLPSTFSLYSSYANTILFRDHLLESMVIGSLFIFVNVKLYSLKFPQAAYITRLLVAGGFYASMAVAFIAFR